MFEQSFEALSNSATRLHGKSMIITSEKEAMTTIKDTLDFFQSRFESWGVDETYKHLDYLAQKAGVATRDLLEGEPVPVVAPILDDAFRNIAAVFNLVKLPDEEDTRDIVERVIDASAAELHGWCTPQKAAALTRYIQQEKPEICVEIGIFGGRSMFPMAAALKKNGKGRIYGIESWSNDVAIENATDEVNDAWWNNVDFSMIKRGVFEFAVKYDLTSQVCIVEASSTKADSLFDSIDFLHIDGSHSMINAATDVVRYATKVRSGGIVVMDDIEWPSTHPAYELLKSFCDILEITDNNDGVPSAAFMRKR